MKGHKKLGDINQVENFPIVRECCYLGVEINDISSVEPLIKKIR